MKQINQYVVALLVASVLIAACAGRVTKEQRRQSDQLMETAYKARHYDRLLTLADSLEQIGTLSPAKANYWRGYAYQRTDAPQKAIEAWQQAMAAAEQSASDEDMGYYVKAASRLANLLCIRGDYEETLRMAQPAAKRIEALGRDTTSDYENLLVYIGCCQAVTGKSMEEVEQGFERACAKHLENIEKNRSDAAYKDAIAGLINIAFYCVTAQKYQHALYYTRHFGELLAEYEQRQDINADYVDRQLGRYDIYKAQALKGLGRYAEADEVFKAYQETKFSKTPEGEALAEDYCLK